MKEHSCQREQQVQRPQGGTCLRYSREWSEVGKDEFGEHGRKIVQGIADHWKNLDFTLSEMGSPRKSFEQRSERI